MTDDFMSEEDKALFREHMRTVKPLGKQQPKIKAAVALPRDKPKQFQIPEKKTSKENYLSDYISEPILSESTLSYCVPSIPTKRFNDLRKGHINWQARLDLHGLKTEDAREALFDFIHSQFHQDKQCLLVIHGKGGHLGAPPVIKNLVNRWLPQFDQVLAFHSALAKDGGHGAVYVLLKRNRY